jgi:hypothetical protein
MASIRTRRKPLAAALATFVALCAQARAADPAPPDHCIVSNNAIGCLSERTLSEIVDYSGNLRGLRGTIADKLASGLCDLFEYGERVYVTDTEGSDRSAVRRPGDTESFWMPSSWSRPANECRANASPESVGKKIGVPTPEPAFPRAARPRAFAREPVLPAAAPRGCVYKSVMTDAEIRACRRVGRRPLTTWQGN